MAQSGLKASISDAAVGALCTHTAVEGAYLNVKINCKDFDDKEFVTQALSEANTILDQSGKKKQQILKTVNDHL